MTHKSVSPKREDVEIVKLAKMLLSSGLQSIIVSWSPDNPTIEALNAWRGSNMLLDSGREYQI
jgi:hypothetical protein